MSLCSDLKLEKVQSFLMFRYQILIEYVGTNFRGWQVQKKVKLYKGFFKKKFQSF